MPPVHVTSKTGLKAIKSCIEAEVIPISVKNSCITFLCKHKVYSLTP